MTWNIGLCAKIFPNDARLVCRFLLMLFTLIKFVVGFLMVTEPVWCLMFLMHGHRILLSKIVMDVRKQLNPYRKKISTSEITAYTKSKTPV